MRIYVLLLSVKKTVMNISVNASYEPKIPLFMGIIHSMALLQPQRFSLSMFL